MKLQKLVYSGPGHAPEFPVFGGSPPQVKQNRKDAENEETNDNRTDGPSTDD